jgi:hypothetical protein
MMLRYWEAIEAHLLPLTKGSPMRALGMWRTELRHTEMLWLWATEGWQGFAQRATQNEMSAEMAKWVYETGVSFRDSWVDKLMEPAEFSPEPTAILADPALNGRLYLHRTVHLRPRHVEDYLRLVGTQLRSVYERRGFALVGCWQTAEGTGAHGEVTHLWNLGDWKAWAAYQEGAGVERRSVYEEERAMAEAIEDRLLQPAPFSPLGGR